MNSGSARASTFDMSVSGEPDQGGSFENYSGGHSIGWSSVVIKPSVRPTIVRLVAGRGLSPSTRMAFVTSRLVG